MLTGDDKGSSYMEDNKDKKPVNKGNPVKMCIRDRDGGADQHRQDHPSGL